jgi:hypothetical protein
MMRGSGDPTPVRVFNPNILSDLIIDYVGGEFKIGEVSYDNHGGW